MSLSDVGAPLPMAIQVAREPEAVGSRLQPAEGALAAGGLELEKSQRR
jgi:hypothetical protein